METLRPETRPLQLEAALRRIQAWRRTKPQYGRIPAQIWEEAVALVGQFGLATVARTLGLDYKLLKKRVAESAPAPVPVTPDPVVLGFVELPGGRLFEGGTEVVAHRSYATAGCAVIATLAEAEALPDTCLEGALVVAQTTFGTTEFQVITAHLRERCPTLRIRDTICRDTSRRQEEAQRLVAKVDAVVVVGGKASNNTRHLVELAQRAGRPVQWVEGFEDLDLAALKGVREVGVLAGASTPTWTVDEVVEALASEGRRSGGRLVRRAAAILQLPFVAGILAITWMLQHSLGWQGWQLWLLPATFHLGLCALLPYLDPLGLARKGLAQARLLAEFKGGVMASGVVACALAIAAAASQGWLVLAGTVLLSILAGVGLRQQPPMPSWVRQLPALRDIAQATGPAVLGILLPWLQGQSGHACQVGTTTLALFCFGLAAHGLRHLRAFHEDRILGREVLPVAVGSRTTRWMALGLVLLGLGTWALGNPNGPVHRAAAPLRSGGVPPHPPFST